MATKTTTTLDYSDDVHHGRADIQKILERAEKELTPKNIEALKRYYDLNKTKALLSQRRSVYDAYCLLKELGKDYDQAVRPDIEKWWQSLIDRYDKDEVSVETLRKRFWQCKKFFRTISGFKKHKYPDCVEWMEWDTDLKTDTTLDPKLLPTQEDVKRLIDYAGGERDV